MGIINQLDFQVANLIAAGEVVDRPSSACKELLENAIDAGATNITVEIKNGGISLMRVSDNGLGMAREDVPVAIKRHATSKIRTASDLETIFTLGFRGEALAAIASVSHLRILTKRAEDDVGTLLDCEPGRSPELSEIGISDGTTVIAEDLFANVPARRKFLKRDQTEAMAVTAAIEKVALSNPSIAVRLIIDGQTRFATTGDGILKNTIYALLGRDFANKLIEIDQETNGIAIAGYIGTPENIRANRNYQNFFINGRYVKSRCAQAALEQAFTSYCPVEKYPTCVLNITLAPQLVDVNVHPAKLEVKFANEKAVFEAVYYAARGALEQRIPRPQLSFTAKTASDLSYEMMKTLNAFVPIEDGENRQKSEKSPYMNRKNVKQGQLSLDEQLNDAFGMNPKPSGDTRMPDEPIDGASIHVSETRPMAELTTRQPEVYPPTSDQTPRDILPPQVQHIKTDDQMGSPVSPISPETIPMAGNRPISPSGSLQMEHNSIDLDTLAQTAPDDRDTLPPEIAAIQTRAVQPEIRDIPLPDEVDHVIKPPTTERKSPPAYKIIGEAFYSYVFIEVGDKVMIIDKHAAHERIIFEELKRNLGTRAVVSQLLLMPVDVLMSPNELSAIEDYRADITSLGFDFRKKDDHTLAVNAIPSLIEVDATADMLITIADRVSSGTGNVQISRDIIFEKALYQASCKAAIKAGHDENEAHIRWICDRLLMLDDIKFCPHGRPVAFELSKHNIEHQFKRN